MDEVSAGCSMSYVPHMFHSLSQTRIAQNAKRDIPVKSRASVNEFKNQYYRSKAIPPEEKLETTQR